MTLHFQVNDIHKLHITLVEGIFDNYSKLYIISKSTNQTYNFTVNVSHYNVTGMPKYIQLCILAAFNSKRRSPENIYI